MPERNYGLFGSFEIPRTASRLQVDRDELGNFWEATEAATAEGLATASGCYIFGMQAGGGATPWYVGQAKKVFKRECFTSHKLVHYNGLIVKRQGTPILVLLARMTPGGKFKKSLGVREANWVERLLIHHCLNANDDLLNIHGVAFPTEVVIPGLLNNPPGHSGDRQQGSPMSDEEG